MAFQRAEFVSLDLTEFKTAEELFEALPKFNDFFYTPKKYDDERKELDLKLCEFVLKLYNAAKIDAEERGKALHFGYTPNPRCVNLRIRYKDESSLYDLFEEVGKEVFSEDYLQKHNLKFSRTYENWKGIRLLKSKFGVMDPDNSTNFFVMLVGNYHGEEIDAFTKEKQFGEDLGRYCQNETEFYFSNTQIFDYLGIKDYGRCAIFVPKESNRRIVKSDPFSNGKWNFENLEGYAEGDNSRLISDVSLYSKKGKKIHFSVKKFTGEESLAHFITLKLDHSSIITGSSYAAGLSVLQNNQELETATEMYENGKSSEEICNCLTKFNLGDLYFDREFSKLLDSEFFRTWKINPILMIQSYMNFDKSIKLGRNNDGLYGATAIKVTDQAALESLKKFIMEATGFGYVLAIAKMPERKLYFKDLRHRGLKEEDCEVLNYTIFYPNYTLEAVVLKIETKSMYFEGQILSKNSLIPDTLEFYYRYKNLEEFMNIKSDVENPILPEGTVSTTGYINGKNTIEPIIYKRRTI